MHYFGKFEDGALAAHPRYAGHSHGHREAALVTEAVGSVHTGLSMNELASGGTLSPHVHSYETLIMTIEADQSERRQRRDEEVRRATR